MLPTVRSKAILFGAFGIILATIPRAEILPVQDAATSPGQRGAAAAAETLTVDDLAPGFLGIYRKVMEIEDEIRRHADRYGLDYDLARAVCMYESGGNAELTSWAGAKGYFQVMPSTARLLRVDSNIEAGIKYLAQMVERFEREDYALAAYNGGPTNVGRNRPMRLESLQYVLGVGHYRTLLKLYEPSVRRHAATLRLEVAGEQDDWWTISKRLGFSLIELRLHNPYIGHRDLRPGWLVAYPPAPREALFRVTADSVEYRSRIGDNYFNVAFAFEVKLDDLRAANGLWHLQTLPENMLLTLPLSWEGDHQVYRVQAGQNLRQLAEMLESSPWRVVRDNALWDERIEPGMVLRVRPLPPKPQFVQHTVRRGDTLTSIAIHYGTSVRAIQEANEMGRRTLIRIGQSLRIPSPATR